MSNKVQQEEQRLKIGQAAFIGFEFFVIHISDFEKKQKLQLFSMATAAVQQPSSAHTHNPQVLQSSSNPSKSGPQDVNTVLHYLKPNADGSPPKPTIADRPETIPPLEAHPVTIHDVRGNEDAYTLDKNGFQFYKHTSKEKEFPSDEYVVSSGYFPEMEEFIKDT